MIGRIHRGFYLSLVASLLWAFLPLHLKWALEYLDPISLTWFRFFLAFSAVAIYRVRYQKQIAPIVYRNRSIALLLGVAVLALLTNYVFNLLGLRRIAATDNQVIIQLGPVFLGFGGLVVFKERYTRKQWKGVVVLALGTVLFLKDQIGLLYEHLSIYLTGAGFILAAAVMWAIYALASKRLVRDITSFDLLTVIYFGGATLFLPWVHFKEIWDLPVGPLVMVAACGLNTLVAYGAFSKALEVWEASKVSAVLTMAPLLTFGFTHLAHAIAPEKCLADSLGTVGIIGASLVVMGSLRVALSRRPRA